MARMVNLLLFERILRNKEEFYTAVIEKKGLTAIIRDATISLTIFGALYGATMGVWSWEPIQIVFSALKVPLLFLISIAVVLPSFYIVNLTTHIFVPFKFLNIHDNSSRIRSSESFFYDYLTKRY